MHQRDSSESRRGARPLPTKSECSCILGSIITTRRGIACHVGLAITVRRGIVGRVHADRRGATVGVERVAYDWIAISFETWLLVTHGRRDAAVLLHGTLADGDLTDLDGDLRYIDVLFVDRNTYGLFLSDWRI